MKGNIKLTGMGVSSVGQRILLFTFDKNASKLSIRESKDGFDFETYKKNIHLKTKQGKKINLNDINEIRPSFFADH
jgi:hypothetical protein